MSCAATNVPNFLVRLTARITGVRAERGANRQGKGGETFLEKSFLLPSQAPILLFQRRLRLSNPCSHASPKAKRPKMALLRRHPRRRDCSAWHSLPHEPPAPADSAEGQRRPRLPKGPPPHPACENLGKGKGGRSGEGKGITFLLKSFPFPPGSSAHPCRSQAKTGKPLIHAAHGVDVGVLKTRLDGCNSTPLRENGPSCELRSTTRDTVALNERIADIRLLLPAGQHRPRFAGRRHEGKNALLHPAHKPAGGP